MVQALPRQQYFDDDVVTTTTSRRLTDFPNFSRHFDAPERKWEREVLKRLASYTRLEQGWDSYQAQPVSMDTAFFAMLILESIMMSRTPVPQVVPTAMGGVQLEWHENDVDLEIHVAAPYHCELIFEDHRNPDQSFETEFSGDFSPLKKPIQVLTSR
jgi:hypothetical protein